MTLAFLAAVLLRAKVGNVTYLSTLNNNCGGGGELCVGGETYPLKYLAL